MNTVIFNEENRHGERVYVFCNKGTNRFIPEHFSNLANSLYAFRVAFNDGKIMIRVIKNRYGNDREMKNLNISLICEALGINHKTGIIFDYSHDCFVILDDEVATYLVLRHGLEQDEGI